MIVSRFHVTSKVPKPGCGLESECGTVNFFAHLVHPPISNPGSTRALNPHMLKTLNYASCGLVHQSFTISSSTSTPPPPPPSVLCTRVQKRTLYQFQLFISAFHFSFSAFFFILFQLPVWTTAVQLYHNNFRLNRVAKILQNPVTV